MSTIIRGEKSIIKVEAVEHTDLGLRMKGSMLDHADVETEGHGPMTFFLDDKRQGLAVGYKIQSLEVFRPGMDVAYMQLLHGGPRPSFYRIEPLPVSGLSAIEASITITLAERMAAEYARSGDFKKMADVIDAFLLPAHRRYEMKIGKPAVPFKDQAKLIVDYSTSLGISRQDIPPRVMEVLNKETLGEAIDSLPSLTREENELLMLLIGAATRIHHLRGQIMDPDFLRLQSAIIRIDLKNMGLT